MTLLLHHVFDASLARRPRASAVVLEDGRSFTYAELDALARHYQALIDDAVRPGDPPYIGLLAAVHAHSIAAVIAILRAGYAYVPLDDAAPDDRLGKILDNTRLAIIVADPELERPHAALLSRVRHTISLVGVTATELAVAPRSPRRAPLADDLAYVLHSSGSTGIPKGIMLSHRNARTFVDWMDVEFAPNPSDVVMARAPFKFDLSVWDVFNTLKAGAEVVCFDWHRKRPSGTKHRAYVDLLRSSRATMLYTTPSVLMALLHHGGLADAPVSLRTIMFAGEPFPPAQLRRLMNALPGVRYANIYGPTETNIITYHWVDGCPGDTPVPLGRVVADTEVLVVDPATSRVCEPDEVGELWCRGGTVTLGYLGQPDATRASEAQSPIHPYPARFWRTGDFGFRDPQGILHYRGRRDHMVKVKGYRIELGDVEHALAAVPGIDTGIVVAARASDGETRLVCHYTGMPDSALEPTAIAAFLATRLPAYMLPHDYQRHHAMPYTSSGKVDRMALAALPLAQSPLPH